MTDITKRTAFRARGDKMKLEGEIFCGASPGVVLCHPHPLYGGSMDSVVVRALFTKLSDVGLSVLRFNFRGVGGSAGSYGGGESEVRDVLGAVDCLKAQCGCESISLLGYSFGAAVALRALDKSGAVRFAAVALPTEKNDEYYGSIPIEVVVPVLFAAGDRDDICRIEHISRVAKCIQPAKELLLGNCDHFFSNLESLEVLCDNVADFLMEN